MAGKGKPNKTQASEVSVDDFLAAVTPDQRREDALAVCALMAEVSGLPPVMWGPSIVGFGSYHYRHDSGREGDMPRVAFSPRSAALVLYIKGGFEGRDAMVAALGKVKGDTSCVYVKKLADVDEPALRRLIQASLDPMKTAYPV